MLSALIHHVTGSATLLCKATGEEGCEAGLGLGCAQRCQQHSVDAQPGTLGVLSSPQLSTGQWGRRRSAASHCRNSRWEQS